DRPLHRLSWRKARGERDGRPQTYFGDAVISEQRRDENRDRGAVASRRSQRRNSLVAEGARAAVRAALSLFVCGSPCCARSLVPSSTESARRAWRRSL